MTTPVLTISDLHQTFEKGTINENHVLRGIDLTMNSGDFITIIGGNGAGKSTLLNSIAGTIPTEQGKIVLGVTKKSHVIQSHDAPKKSVVSSKTRGWGQPFV